MKFKVGDKVSVLDDAISGKVIKIHTNLVTIITEDGFEMEFSPDELIKIQNDKVFQAVDYVDLESAQKHQETKRKQPLKQKRKEKEMPPMEVDLHIHQLVPSTKGMTNHDMLTLQLETARRQLEFAIKKRIQRVVFIHGVGEGILRTELEYLFGRYDSIKFYDANYQKYGLGATEVYIFQNAKEADY